MQSKVRVMGHAVHPMLVDFPIVCFVVLAILDVAQGLGYLPASAALNSLGLLLVGIGGGATVLAIVTGAIDFFFIPRKTAARRTGAIHFVLGIIVWFWFGAASYGHTTASLGMATGIDVAGILLVVVQSYLGGELMSRHHIGIRSQAEGADPVVLGRPKAN